ncbi:MAG: VanZ family protein [Parcubacteria group bacterium]
MLVRWLLALGWAGVIWGLSSIPELKTGLEQDFILRKIAHGFEFAVLVILLIRALPTPRRGNWVRYVGAVVLALEYAAIDEIHQGFVPGREPSLRDVGIDALGVLVGVVVIYTWNRARRGKALHTRSIKKPQRGKRRR